MPKPITHNTLFYGDNLRILREHFVDECVDLIYLDPPFNSNRSYNVLFKDESGEEAEAQIRAFEDSWHWGTEAEQTYHELVTRAPDRVSKMIGALREFIGANQMMAYLVMMAARLVELHRVLKPTGSLYLHCDPTASHYLKIVLDSVFSIENFQNEIIWKRTSAHSDSKTFGNTHDVLIACTKTDEFVWNKQYQTYDESYVKSHYRYVDKNGRKYRTDNLTAMGLSGGGYTYAWNGVTKIWRLPESKMKELHELGRLHYTKSGSVEYIRYLDEMPGTPLQDMWDDIPPINAQAAERLGYPTQKPLALLERIINASSNEGDIVLDPFCGCGTAIAAAQKLNRKWIGIDITHLAIALQKNRLQDMFYLKPNKDYKVIGEPEDVASAQLLAHDDRYQFQFWALSLAQARPIGGIEGSKQGKKGSDKGIDGVITFLDDDERKPLRVLIQVKSGHIKSGDIRDLRGTVEREKAAIGIFITLEKPTKEMEKEAVT
ncbi:MAG: restriction endonuclease, partial [Chloroflexi bacterium]|nr:restriction endonuclease [Chloroflexota bacterium]